MKLWTKGILACSVMVTSKLFNNEVMPWNYNWDFMDTNNFNGNTDCRTCHHIILVRHGQYMTTKDTSDKKLTELGRMQAAFTGKKLRELNIKF